MTEQDLLLLLNLRGCYPQNGSPLAYVHVDLLTEAITEIERLRDLGVEAFSLLREHQEAHGTADKQRPHDWNMPGRVFADGELEAERWRTRRDSLIAKVAGVFDAIPEAATPQCCPYSHDDCHCTLAEGHEGIHLLDPSDAIGDLR